MAPAPAPRQGGGSTSAIGRRRDRARSSGTDSYRERRREIARVAAQVFNQKGFRGTSLGAVAAALGTDRASLYYYIASKEELFDEVVREATEANVATAEAIGSSGAPAAEKLRTLVRELMASYARNYPLQYVYIRENLSHVAPERSAWSQHMRGLNRRYEECVVAIVQEGIDDGTFRPLASARVVAYGILGMVGWTNRWFVPDRSRETADQIGSAYAEMVLAGLRA